jgi:ribonucleotide monophosphatase NagD (HAD superfamily)
MGADLLTLVQETTGRRLEATVFGKPFGLTYDYANEVLRAMLVRRGAQGHAQAERAQAAQTLGPRVWMVGDNPASDIAGAVAYGWASALVRTGVYHDAAPPPIPSPTLIVDNVEHAVQQAITREWNL